MPCRRRDPALLPFLPAPASTREAMSTTRVVMLFLITIRTITSHPLQDQSPRGQLGDNLTPSSPQRSQPARFRAGSSQKNRRKKNGSLLNACPRRRSHVSHKKAQWCRHDHSRKVVSEVLHSPQERCSACIRMASPSQGQISLIGVLFAHPIGSDDSELTFPPTLSAILSCRILGH